jgi:hypothetical protein
MLTPSATRARPASDVQARLITIDVLTSRRRTSGVPALNSTKLVIPDLAG